MSNLGLKTIAPPPEGGLLAEPRRRAPEDPKQRGLMVGSLCLLLLALGIVLWHDRDFWFPETPEEADQSVESQPVPRPPAAAIPQSPAIVSKSVRTAKSRHVAPVQRSTRVAVK